MTAKIAVIPTGMELHEGAGGDGAGFRNRFAIAAGRATLVFIDRVACEKNIGFLLDVLVIVRKPISDVLLVIAGKGTARHWLEKKVARPGLGNNALFVGYRSRGDSLLDCYCAADLP